jgi:hypothetical protein
LGSTGGRSGLNQGRDDVDNTDKETPARNKGRAPPQTDEAAKTKVEKKPQAKAKDAVAKPAPAARTKARPARAIEAGKTPETDTTSAEAAADRAQAAPAEPAQPALPEAMEAHVAGLEPMYAAASEQQAPIEAEVASPTEAQASPVRPEPEPLEAAQAKVEEEPASWAAIGNADIQKIGEKRSEREKIGPENSVAIFVADIEAITAESINYSKKSFENGSALIEKLLVARSFESAIQISTDFVQRSYKDFITSLTKIGALYARLPARLSGGRLAR